MSIYQFLLAAEADQIQDFIFRASRLVEVVGGSQLLSRFCEEVPSDLKSGKYPEAEIIVSDGGAFRILFEANTKEKAESKSKAFGRDLAAEYRSATGGNLTVAEPVLQDQGFKTASDKAQANLREAKNRGDAPSSTLDLPYFALCASCGVAIAAVRHRRHADERENYYCTWCREKEKERDGEIRRVREKQDLKGFLGKFWSVVAEACQPSGLGVPDDFPQDADAVGAFDLTGRRYVAYLLADGNGMGGRFSACPNKETMRKLSLALPEVIRASLAAHCPELIRRIQGNNQKMILPLMPLILGGDDLFALLPAPWAIDFAARFCDEYEKRMQQKLQELQLLIDENDVPTVAAAVVICKANYPHTLAHDRGEALLKQAKQLARGLEAQGKGSVSVLNFTLITGSEVTAESADDDPRYRPAACPYFIQESLSTQLQEAALPIRLLLKHRLALGQAELPATRRAQFERLYDEASQFSDEDELAVQWKPRCQALLERIGRRRSTLKDHVARTLQELGDANEERIGYWRYFERPFDLSIRGHGFADLLRIWHYAYDVTEDIKKY